MVITVAELKVWQLRSSLGMAKSQAIVEMYQDMQLLAHPMFWGDSNERDEVCRFHPEGMPAISRGLCVRDTPGAQPPKGDLHPEGMRASSECLPVS